MSRGFPSLATLVALAAARRRRGAQTLPVADAGDDQSFPCAPVTGAEVTLDGSGSSDPDDPLAVLTYTWSGDAARRRGDPRRRSAGRHAAARRAHADADRRRRRRRHRDRRRADHGGGRQRRRPRSCCRRRRAELWPPNHKVHAFDAADYVMTVTDSCDIELGPEDVLFARGTSDEADNGKGDGNTTGDISFDAGCATALLRSERAGPEDGRVYELVLSVQDAAGQRRRRAVLTVSVPHDQAHDAVDSGDVFEVVAAECGADGALPARARPRLPRRRQRAGRDRDRRQGRRRTCAGGARLRRRRGRVLGSRRSTTSSASTPTTAWRPSSRTIPRRPTAPAGSTRTRARPSRARRPRTPSSTA